jgi:tetratricopeptide (TPR) repeat protein
MANRPQEALGFLEGVLIQDPGNVRASLYLGVVYLQLGRPEDAIAIYRKILPRAGNEAARVAFNLGDVYFSLGNNEYAEEFYTQALALDIAYAPAYLNRANLRIKKGDLMEALPDYELYLTLEPRSPQRPQIEQLIALIRGEYAAAERRRILAEEEAERQRIKAAEEAERQRVLAAEEAERQRIRAEEAERQRAAAAAEAERRRVEEAERQRLLAEEMEARRQALLREVSASLQSAAEETRGSSAGAEGILDYEGEFELE